MKSKIRTALGRLGVRAGRCMVNRFILAAPVLAASIGVGTWTQAGIIDVNLTQSGGPVATGFTDWATGDNSVPGNLVIDGYTLSAPVAGINAGTTLRSINRGGNDGYTGTFPELTQTWWGQRQTSTGPGGFITIDIAGLAAGDYSFTGWFLDQEDQTGEMTIDFSNDDGGTFTDGVVPTFDLVSGDQGATAPIVRSFDFTSTGDDVQFRFRNVSVDGAGSSGAFALVNGFSIAVVPEPSSLALLGLGGVGLYVLRRRSRGIA